MCECYDRPTLEEVALKGTSAEDGGMIGGIPKVLGTYEWFEGDGYYVIQTCPFCESTHMHLDRGQGAGYFVAECSPGHSQNRSPELGYLLVLRDGIPPKPDKAAGKVLYTLTAAGEREVEQLHRQLEAQPA